MMLDIPKLQRTLGVKDDGQAGVGTFTALFRKMGATADRAEELASGQAYEGRTDLGNTQPGDGKRFKGRGPIQITGRANYRHFGRKIGIEIERHPEIAAVPSIGLHLALEYWRSRNLNALADADDIEGITRKINGGLNGFADRKAHLAKIKGWLA